MNKVEKIIDIMKYLDLNDIVDLDMYVYRNELSQLANLYKSLTHEEYEELLDKLDKQRDWEIKHMESFNEKAERLAGFYEGLQHNYLKEFNI